MMLSSRAKAFCIKQLLAIHESPDLDPKAECGGKPYSMETDREVWTHHTCADDTLEDASEGEAVPVLVTHAYKRHRSTTTDNKKTFQEINVNSHESSEHRESRKKPITEQLKKEHSSSDKRQEVQASRNQDHCIMLVKTPTAEDPEQHCDHSKASHEDGVYFGQAGVQPRTLTPKCDSDFKWKTDGWQQMTAEGKECKMGMNSISSEYFQDHVLTAICDVRPGWNHNFQTPCKSLLNIDLQGHHRGHNKVLNQSTPVILEHGSMLLSDKRLNIAQEPHADLVFQPSLMKLCNFGPSLNPYSGPCLHQLHSTNNGARTDWKPTIRANYDDMHSKTSKDNFHNTALQGEMSDGQEHSIISTKSSPHTTTLDRLRGFDCNTNWTDNPKKTSDRTSVANLLSRKIAQKPVSQKHSEQTNKKQFSGNQQSKMIDQKPFTDHHFSSEGDCWQSGMDCGENYLAVKNDTKQLQSDDILEQCTCFGAGGMGIGHHPNVIKVTGIPGTPCVSAELCQPELWDTFHSLGTEMIITRAGRRMFPALRLRMRGLDADSSYRLSMEFVHCSSNKYRYVYHSSKWMKAGVAEVDLIPATRLYPHPDGFLGGNLLMSQGVSFEKVKLTNNLRAKPGQVALKSMQKFQPRIILETVRETVGSGDVPLALPAVFTFPQTSFMAVTAYQNQQITKLKIARNPFAKGFRESNKARNHLAGVMTSPVISEKMNLADHTFVSAAFSRALQDSSSHKKAVPAMQPCRLPRTDILLTPCSPDTTSDSSWLSTTVPWGSTSQRLKSEWGSPCSCALSCHMISMPGVESEVPMDSACYITCQLCEMQKLSSLLPECSKPQASGFCIAK